MCLEEQQMVCQQRQGQAGLPRCIDVPCPISLSRATVSPVVGFCLRTSWLAALHAWRAAGAARLGKSRSGKSETDVAYHLLFPLKCGGFPVLRHSGVLWTWQAVANCQPWRRALRWRVNVWGSAAARRSMSECGWGQAVQRTFVFILLKDAAGYLS